MLKLVLLATKKRTQRFTNFIVTWYVIYRTQPTQLFLTKRKLHRLSAGHVYFFCSSWLSSHLIFNFLLLSHSINKIWKGWPRPRDLCCVFPNAWPHNLVPRAFPSKHVLREKPWGRGWPMGRKIPQIIWKSKMEAFETKSRLLYQAMNGAYHPRESELAGLQSGSLRKHPFFLALRRWGRFACVAKFMHE